MTNGQNYSLSRRCAVVGMGMGMGIGMVVCRVQQKSEVENAEKEIKELKQRRSEDAKANDKVVSIFAAREYRWCVERKNLRLQVGGLINELRVVKKSNEESVSEFELILMEETDQKLRASEGLVEELRESVKRHETAYIELVSKQEAEMGRTVQKVEEAKRELETVLECKEQLVFVNQRLSIELVKMHKVLEQKDETLWKSGLGTAEKQMVLKDVKTLKGVTRKQAEEVEMAESESKDEGRNVLSKDVQSKLGPNPHELSANVVRDTDWSRVKVVQRKATQEMKVKDEQVQGIVWTLEESPFKEIKQGLDHFQERNNQSSNNCTWKMDIHALGVSYKLNTLLKHQLFIVERLKKKQQTCAFMSLINKQLDHYRSLQRKTDHLCIRMHENSLNSKRGSKEDERQRMEQFLEQIFQLQRYAVETGQILIQVQAAKIGTSLVADADHFESIKALFLQVQRGLELRIFRLMGDLERALTLRTIVNSREFLSLLIN